MALIRWIYWNFQPVDAHFSIDQQVSFAQKLGIFCLAKIAFKIHQYGMMEFIVLTFVEILIWGEMAFSLVHSTSHLSGITHI